MPQAPNGWWYEVVDQQRRGGLVVDGQSLGGKVWTEIQAWRSQAEQARGAPPFILNNFKSQVRERHSRLVKFGTAYRIAATGQLVADPRDRMAAAVPLEVFERSPANVFIPVPWRTYDGRYEELPGVFEREEFTLPVMDQVTVYIEQFLERAERLGWSGDLRGSTENLIVAASADDYRVNDDGSTYSDTTSGAGSKINVHSTAASRLNLAWRFLSVDIANASTINSVTFTGNVDSTFRDDFDAFMYFEAADTAAAFSDTASRHFINSGGVTLTTGTGNFNNIATGTGDVSTGWPSLVADLQEVVNRAGFATGNAVALGMLADSSGTANMDGQIESYDGSTSLCVRLSIDYTAPVGGTTRRYTLPTLGVG